jgi:hypothetical protein
MKMSKKIRVNIRTVANMGGIRRERRNGRDKIIVPSATLPDGIVMNNIQYPADEIEKGFATLNGTLAPLGHPTVNGQFVSASHPEGINIGWIGAYNENVRRENGRVYLDKVIDVARANESEGGKAVLAAIEKGEPIHTSTGLLCDLEDTEGDGFKHIARNMLFDHDAILLGEEGAATPEQGVGMLVNASGEATEIEVINSALEDADRELDWAVDHLARALERRERVPMLERMKTALIEAFTPMREPDPTLNKKESEMDKEQFDALSAKVNALTDAQDKMGETIANAVKDAVKPLVDAQAEMKANQDAKDKAELEGHVAAIVKANILDEESAKELTLNAARKLAEKAKPGKAAALNGAFGGKEDADEWEGYSLNAAIDGTKEKAVN